MVTLCAAFRDLPLGFLTTYIKHQLKDSPKDQEKCYAVLFLLIRCQPVIGIQYLYSKKVVNHFGEVSEIVKNLAKGKDLNDFQPYLRNSMRYLQ